MPEPPPLSSDADRPSIAETEIAEPREIASPPSLPAEIIALPSVESVRRVLSDVQRAETSQFYSYNCNKLEREKEFSRCAPLDDRNYAEISSNSVSEFYSPPVEVSRSRQTVTTLARHSDCVAGQLALNNLPPGLSAYVMEEIELGYRNVFEYVQSDRWAYERDGRQECGWRNGSTNFYSLGATTIRGIASSKSKR